jgi:hypothetical protein
LRAVGDLATTTRVGGPQVLKATRDPAEDTFGWLIALEGAEMTKLAFAVSETLTLDVFVYLVRVVPHEYTPMA